MNTVKSQAPVPVFARLRDARIQAGLTQEQVADYLGIRRPAIAEIEAGKRAVKSDELLRLAELYGRSLKWLVQGAEGAEERIAGALFRAHEPTSPLLKREAAKLARRCRLVGELEEKLGLERHHQALPQYANERALHDFSLAAHHGAEVAYQERARLRVGVAAPIRDVWGLVEDAGLHVFPLHLGREGEIDGIFTRIDETRACVGVNVEKWVFRQVFTVVHEYGHALMDGDTPAEACITSRGWTSHKRSRYNNREFRANQFAAVFLVPREALLRYLEARGKVRRARLTELTPMDVVRAQDHFGVSAEMLLWRLQEESLIAATERKELAAKLAEIGVVALARALGYDWRDRAQPFTRVHELALQGYAKGLVTLGIVADLFDRVKEDMHDLLQAWGVRQEFAPGDALVGTAN
ncbi:MAG: XRE family transcriptional regulator [Gemmatimonadales bacterium]|nr:XRE family transcriptional regulator [Gemmatimonadales bacterium]